MLDIIFFFFFFLPPFFSLIPDDRLGLGSGLDGGTGIGQWSGGDLDPQ